MCSHSPEGHGCRCSTTTRIGKGDPTGNRWKKVGARPRSPKARGKLAETGAVEAANHVRGADNTCMQVFVMLGRPFRHDPGLNQEIMGEFEKLGCPIFFQNTLPTAAKVFNIWAN